MAVRVEEIERIVSDHAQRFDTLQSKPWKRFWFWVWEGYPLWSDLNADKRAWRLWRR